MSFEEHGQAAAEDQSGEPVLRRQQAMSPDQIAEWQIHQGGVAMASPDYCPEDADGDSSDAMSEGEGDDDVIEDDLPLDLGWYFDQFDLGAKERIRLCSTYASMLRAQEQMRTPAKKRRRVPDKIIDLSKD